MSWNFTLNCFFYLLFCNFFTSGDCSIHQFHGGHVANVPQLQGEFVCICAKCEHVYWFFTLNLLWIWDLKCLVTGFCFGTITAIGSWCSKQIVSECICIYFFQGNIWEQIFQVSFLLEMLNTVPFIITVRSIFRIISQTRANNKIWPLWFSLYVRFSGLPSETCLSQCFSTAGWPSLLWRAW